MLRCSKPLRASCDCLPGSFHLSHGGQQPHSDEFLERLAECDPREDAEPVVVQQPLGKRDPVRNPAG
eukprot:scaffold673149_cov42-Prasinocladus_malaysianus.AAC.1